MSSASLEGAEIVAYCHSGSRSRFAAEVLVGAGYKARNYVGSWHEWSREVVRLAPTRPPRREERVGQRAPLRVRRLHDLLRPASSSGAGIGSSSGSSSAHVVTIGSVTSAWNWMPQAGCRRGGTPACRSLLRASSTPSARDLERVVVPLEHRRRGRRTPSTGRRRPAGVTVDVEPSDLRRARGPDRRSGGAREHLRSQADPEDRDPGREHVGEELLLVREPVEAVVLVRVHRPAEDHDGVVVRGRIGRAPVRDLPASRGCGRPPRPPRRRPRPARSGRGSPRGRAPADCTQNSVGATGGGSTPRWRGCRPRREARAGSSRSAARSRRGCC